jgi:uncharacterized protein YneF (UPF0154 family)
VAALNTLQSNHQIVEALRKNPRLNENAIPEMVDFWKTVGYSVRAR